MSFARFTTFLDALIEGYIRTYVCRQTEAQADAEGGGVSVVVMGSE